MSAQKSSEGLIWDIAVKQLESRQKTASSEDDEDTTLLIVGGKNAGKTTIILRFLDRNESAKPTTALEYTFARKPHGVNQKKDVAHIWELGGGTFLANLVETTINKKSLKKLSVVLVLDLTKPTQLITVMESYINSIKKRIAVVTGEAPHLQHLLNDGVAKRIHSCKDKQLIDPFPVPLILLCTKYDLFQEMDTSHRRLVSATLRFFAHWLGASLLFTSSKTESLVKLCKTVLNNHAFGVSKPKLHVTDFNRPLVVFPGNDSLEAIGSPPVSEFNLAQMTSRIPLQLWKQCFISEFPQEIMLNPTIMDDPGKDSQFTEPLVDQARLHKDQDLERYKRETGRNRRTAGLTY